MKTFEEIKNNKQLKILSWRDEEETSFRGEWFDPLSGKRYFIIFTASFGWEHLSVSTPSKTPSWDVMCKLKDVFWNEDEVCMQLHPAKSDYVNMHEHCLHIWKPINEVVPTPPSIMVGFKDVDSKQTELLANMMLNNMSDEELIKLGESRGIKVSRQMKRGKFNGR